MPIGRGSKLAEVYVQVRADQKTLRRDMTGIRRYLTGTVKSMSGIMTAAFRPLRGMLGLVGGVSLVALAKQTISMAAAQEQAERKLAAVLKATGGAAGYSAEQLIKLADSLQTLTAWGDDATINMMAVLATFRNISGPIFTDAVKAIQDMSSVLGQDLQQGAIQVGKALNDPIIGFTALQRVGVSFTQEQKEMIKTLFKAGDVMGAQAVILEELKGEFGGAAEMMATTLSGQLKGFINRMGDIGEKIGHTLTTYLMPLTDHLETLAKWFEINHRWLLVSIKEWTVFIAKAGALVYGLAALIKIVSALTRAYQVLAHSQLVVTALQGPKGWAVLAGAVAATAVTAKLLKERFNDVTSAIGRAADEAQRLAGALPTTKETALGETHGETFAFASAKRAQIRGLEEEIAALDKEIARLGPTYGDPEGRGGQLRRRLALAQETLVKLETEGQKQFETWADAQMAADRAKQESPAEERRALMAAGIEALQEKRAKQREERLKALGATLFRGKETMADMLSYLSTKKGIQLAGIGATRLGGGLGDVIGRVAGGARAAGRAGLAGLGLAARVARPEMAAEAPGRGGFTGIAELSRTLQMGIFGSHAERIQEEQAKRLEEIAKSNEAAKKSLEKLVQEGLGVFAVGN